MKHNTYYFEDTFTMYYNNHMYNVEVEGRKMRDEFNHYSHLTEIDEVFIEDETGNTVNEDHPDYEDLYQDIIDRDFEIECEEEGVDVYDSSDMF